MYPIAKMERFDAFFRMQLHFNFLATWATQKQKQANNMTRASHLRDVDLDALIENTSTLAVISSKRQELSRYVLEDILDCPIGSRFLYALWRKTMMTTGVITIWRWRKLSKAT